MLIQSSVSTSIEALSFVSDHGKQDLLCGWISSGKTWQESPTCPEHHLDFATEQKKDDSSILSRTCSKLSTVSAMCTSSAPNLVYKRRKLQKNSCTLLPPNLVYKRKKLQRNSGTYSPPNLVYKRKKLQRNSGTLLPTILVYKRKKLQRNSGTPLPPNLVYKRRELQRNSGTHLPPNLVYKRREMQRNSCTLLPPGASNSTKGSGCCLSSICSEMPSLSTEKDSNLHSHIDNDSYSVRGAPSLCNKDLPGIGNSSISEQVYPHNLDDIPCSKVNKTKVSEVLSKSVSNDGCSGGEVEGCDEAQNSNTQKSAFVYHNVNDSCSSSKSNIELGSSSCKNDMDEAGECSSSDIPTTDLSRESLTEKELCISILRRHGLLRRVSPVRNCTSNDVRGIGADRNNFQSCKICGRLENPKKMLICDHCEEAFHVSCCNPRMRNIPVDEWYCQPCSRKKRKLSAETTGKSIGAKSEASKCKNSRTIKDELGAISFMLNDTEPYTTGVRIGKDFQANVPDWSGPIVNDVDCIGEPSEMDPTDCGSLCGLNANKSSSFSSIGNWLQCREVLDDGTEEGTVCGKWRRAPLFEIQTDDWDCSCAVVWDPVHSDCAVPQELETDQVLKHLKYIEKLRPRLVAKKQKLSHSKSDTEDTRSVT